MCYETWIAIGVLALILGCAIAYVVKSKKSGKKCIGCPSGCSCSAKGGKTSDGCGSCCCCGEKAQQEREEQSDDCCHNNQ
jgi:hypothetical protein